MPLQWVRCLSKEGCLVAINGRNKNKLSKATKEVPRSFSVQGDITSHKIAKKVIKKVLKILGGIDILVCNVGSGKSQKTGQESYREWDEVFKKNFSVYYVIIIKYMNYGLLIIIKHDLLF